jgi:hypothetical protein
MAVMRLGIARKSEESTDELRARGVASGIGLITQPESEQKLLIKCPDLAG